MPAGKQKDPDPALLEDEAQEDLVEEPDLEYPAVGETVAYVTTDTATHEPVEEAALITHVNSDGTTVSLTVFALHSRAGRPIMDVAMGPVQDPEDTSPYWRYPVAKVIEVPEEVTDE